MRVVTDAVARLVELGKQGVDVFARIRMARHSRALRDPGAHPMGLLMLPQAAIVARFLTAKEGHKFNLQGLWLA